MKREQVLSRLGYQVPANMQVRVIVHSDVKNEADDQFAIVHHLLTPSFDVRGVIAAHFEGRFIEGRKVAEMLRTQGIPYTPSDFFVGEGTSMQQSFAELARLVELCGIDDVPICRGCAEPLLDENDMPDSEGVQLIIREAQKEDDRPLYLLLQGCLTDLAAALKRAPEIADRLTAVWIGGGAYPSGGSEFNMMQDVTAARIVFSSPVKIWQIPVNAYSEIEVSFAELADRVRPCGKVGRYLFDQLMDMNVVLSQFQGIGRKGENWCLGDQPTVGVLLQSENRGHFHLEKAPFIGENLEYIPNTEGKAIRVYDHVDVRMLLNDFYGKLKLCYGTFR